MITASANWAYDKSTMEGLLFCAQRMEEAVDDRTLDSHKSKTLTPALLLAELKDVLRYVERGILHEANVRNVWDEFEDSAKTDGSLEKCLDINLSEFIKSFLSLPEIERRSKAVLLSQVSAPRRYFDFVLQSLHDAVVANDWCEIEKYCTLLISTLRAIGYSRGFIYKQVHDFWKSKNITTANDIKLLKESFSGSNRSFRVVFAAPKRLDQIKDTLAMAGIQILSDRKVETLAANEKQLLIEVTSVEALDEPKARHIAFDRLEKLSNIFSLLKHLRKERLSDEACVFEQTDAKRGKFIAKLKPEKSPMRTGFDRDEQRADLVFGELIGNLSFDRSSFVKFGRVIDLHSACLDTEDAEAMLLNLWICFETLVDHKGDEGRVEGIWNGLEPFIGAYYFEKHFTYVYEMLRVWDLKKTQTAISGVTSSETRPWARLAHVILLPTYKGALELLIQQASDWPLIVYRIKQVKKRASTVNQIRSGITAHLKRVQWHIYRIYRMRNLIVHKGRASAMAESLVEHAHNYFDLLIDGIIRSSGRVQGMSIQQHIDYGRVRWNDYIKLLSNSNASDLNEDNLAKLLFPST